MINYIKYEGPLKKVAQPNIFVEANNTKIEILQDNTTEHVDNDIFNSQPNNSTRNLMITEIYNKSIFSLGFGTGKILNTFTLLPGEETEITISSSMTTSLEYESILDSYSDNSKKSFETTVNEQETDESKNVEIETMNGAAKARANWGLGNAKGSGSFNYSMQASRDNFSEKMKNSIKKHASTASASRVVKVDMKNERVITNTSETVLRKIKNPNINCTLNFTFHQLTQHFLIIEHLIDVKLCIWDLDNSDHTKGKLYEYSLQQLDNLLKDFIKEEKKEKVKDTLLAQLHFYDYLNESKQIYEIVVLPNGIYRRFLKTNTDYIHVNPDGSQETITVPGYILSADTITMGANGIVAETVLGNNPALEDYLLKTRDEDIRLKQLENNQIELLNDRERLVQDLAQDVINSSKIDILTKAEFLQKMFCCNCKCLNDENKISNNEPSET
uniref:hypothetical protein n=1 Tax=Clostridium sp. 12(A) TaxID=1163671 RepID=UPI0004676850|nr:hypothetical protein [Clostridium sp. 12(A)]